MATYSASGGGKDFEIPEEGTHMAVCTLVADVGLQPGRGQYPDPKRMIYMRFEIPSIRISYEKDGVEKEGPAIIYNNYTASMSPKAWLRKRIESWFGKKFANDGDAEQFDTRKVLGHTCMLLVVHSPDGKYANIDNIMQPPKGADGKLPKLKPEGAVVYYGPDDDAQYEDLPKFLREKVDNQLDPAVAKPPPPVNAPGSRANPTNRPAPTKATGSAPTADEQEASREAQRCRRERVDHPFVRCKRRARRNPAFNLTCSSMGAQEVRQVTVPRSVSSVGSRKLEMFCHRIDDGVTVG